MLAAACAVGVACTYGAPIGGMCILHTLAMQCENVGHFRSTVQYRSNLSVLSITKLLARVLCGFVQCYHFSITRGADE